MPNGKTSTIRREQWPHTVLLHDTKELDDDLGGRTDQDLSLSGLLGVVDGVQRIVEDGGLDHFGGWRFSDRGCGNEVSASKLYVSLHGLLSMESALMIEQRVLQLVV